MTNAKWVLFDVGGVLLDWRRSASSLARFLQVTDDELLDAMFAHAPKMNIGVVSPQEGWRNILTDLNRDSDPQDAILRWRAKEFWLPDSLRLVRELNEHGYKLAILSNSWLGLTNDPSDRTMPPELSLFAHILDSSKEGIKKPNPAFYELAEKTVKASSDQIFFIDDDAPNLEPANRKGWGTYHFDMGSNRDGKQANDELRAILLAGK